MCKMLLRYSMADEVRIRPNLRWPLLILLAKDHLLSLTEALSGAKLHCDQGVPGKASKTWTTNLRVAARASITPVLELWVLSPRQDIFTEGGHKCGVGEAPAESRPCRLKGLIPFSVAVLPNLQ